MCVLIIDLPLFLRLIYRLDCEVAATVGFCFDFTFHSKYTFHSVVLIDCVDVADVRQTFYNINN